MNITIIGASAGIVTITLPQAQHRDEHQLTKENNTFFCLCKTLLDF